MQLYDHFIGFVVGKVRHIYLIAIFTWIQCQGQLKYPNGKHADFNSFAQILTTDKGDGM